MFSDSETPVVVSVKNVSKCYHIYDQPRHRLKQMIVPKLQRLGGYKPARYYREFWALKDVSFDVRKGESIGLIGRNGSGKSSLLQVIAGTLTPTSGAVETSGRVAALLELGAGFNPEFTGRENVYLNASILGIQSAEFESMYEKIVEFADIGAFIEQPVKTYSSGMFVRLAFAVQAHVCPEILIVDEALSVGDFFFQQKCIRFMREKMVDCTKILVTHDMQAIINFCSRVIVMKDGQIDFIGDVKEGVERYLRSSHNDLFKDEQAAHEPSVAEGTPRKQMDRAHMQPITSDKIGGRGGAIIKAFCLSVNNEVHQSASCTVRAQDKIDVSFAMDVNTPAENFIFGYLIVDRNGQFICGDNTLSLGHTFSVQAGDTETEVLLSFKWPNIAPGEYSLTLGVGNGHDAMQHVIECWAHSVFSFKNLSDKPVHGIFTNPLEEATFQA